MPIGRLRPGVRGAGAGAPDHPGSSVTNGLVVLNDDGCPRVPIPARRVYSRQELVRVWHGVTGSAIARLSNVNNNGRGWEDFELAAAAAAVSSGGSRARGRTRDDDTRWISLRVMPVVAGCNLINDDGASRSLNLDGLTLARVARPGVTPMPSPWHRVVLQRSQPPYCYPTPTNALWSSYTRCSFICLT